MPLYEYQCKKCKHRFEKIHQSYSEPRVKKCPECGGPVVELLSAPAAHFKGSGWYATDYARKPEGGGKSGSGSKESGSSESMPDDSSASKAKEKTETKSASTDSSSESKPKTESKKRK